MSVIDDLKPKSSIEKSEPMKCNCQDEKADINNTIRILKIVQYCWADQIPYENQKISDCEAITQVIKCLEEYKESCERVKNASH